MSFKQIPCHVFFRGEGRGEREEGVFFKTINDKIFVSSLSAFGY